MRGVQIEVDAKEKQTAHQGMASKFRIFARILLTSFCSARDLSWQLSFCEIAVWSAHNIDPRMRD
jgi:hypothetical protein